MRFSSLVLASLLLGSSNVRSQEQGQTAMIANGRTNSQSELIALGQASQAEGSYFTSLMGYLETARKHSLEYIPGLKRAAFELSLRDVLRKTKEATPGVNNLNDRWNVIYTNEKNGAKLILGMIPLREYRHKHTLIDKYQVKAVISLLEEFELEPGWFATPVLPSEWRMRKVRHYQIITADFNPLSIEKISSAVADIQFHWNKGETVYVHCKAGVGRSATAAAAWLALNRLNDEASGLSIRDDAYLEKLVDEVVEDILRIRTINLHAAQKKAILNYLISLRRQAPSLARR